jgi:hypothetical protein
MEQITSSLAARTAPKSTVSGSGSDAAGSVTKRFFSPQNLAATLISSDSDRLSNELMTLMVSVLRVQLVALLINFLRWLLHPESYVSKFPLVDALSNLLYASSRRFQSLMPTSSNG